MKELALAENVRETSKHLQGIRDALARRSPSSKELEYILSLIEELKNDLNDKFSSSGGEISGDLIADGSATIKDIVVNNTLMSKDASIEETLTVKDILVKNSIETTNINAFGKISASILDISGSIEAGSIEATDISAKSLDISGNVEAGSIEAGSIEATDISAKSLDIDGSIEATDISATRKIIANDVVVNGNISKHSSIEYKKKFILPPHENDLVTENLGIYSISIFAKDIDSMSELLDESRDYQDVYIQYRRTDIGNINEETIPHYLTKDANENNCLILENPLQDVNRIIVSYDPNSRDINIVAVMDNNERKPLASINDNDYSSQIAVDEFDSDLVTVEDLEKETRDLSSAIDKKIDKDSAFDVTAEQTSVNGNVIIAPGHSIVQEYDDDVPQRYLTAKDLNDYDPFSEKRKAIAALERIENTAQDEPLMTAINCLNEIITILKNN